MEQGQFFGMVEASELAINKWGFVARCWNDKDNPDPKQRCRIGTGGCGQSHTVYGAADNWLDAAREAGLL